MINVRSETIIKMLQMGRWTSMDVNAAYLSRVDTVPLTGVARPSKRLIRALAEERDRFWKHRGQPRGLLHGVPVGIVEHDDPDNWAGLSDEVAEWDCRLALKPPLVRALVQAGAVLHTYVVYHPGAEARLMTEHYLVENRCCPLAVGVNGPSATSAVWSLRPSPARLPKGHQPETGVTGLISNSLSGLSKLMETLIGQEPWLSDPSLIPRRWHRGSLLDWRGARPFRLGVLMEGLTEMQCTKLSEVARWAFPDHCCVELVPMTTADLRDTNPPARPWLTAPGARCLDRYTKQSFKTSPSVDALLYFGAGWHTRDTSRAYRSRLGLSSEAPILLAPAHGEALLDWFPAGLPPFLVAGDICKEQEIVAVAMKVMHAVEEQSKSASSGHYQRLWQSLEELLLGTEPPETV